jgi:predicted nuclease with TOPRIM domain
MGEISLFGSASKKKGKGGGLGDDGLTGEEAQELIDELKNDLKLKEMEFDEMKAQFAKIEAENRRLREQYQKERNERMVIEGKLKKTAIHAELREASEDINKNVFFEKKKSKLSSLNSTLLTTVRF